MYSRYKNIWYSWYKNIYLSVMMTDVARVTRRGQVQVSHTCVYLQPLLTTTSQRLTTVGTKTIGTVGTKIFGIVITKTFTSVSSQLSISSPRSQQTHRDYSHVPISPSSAKPVHHTYSWRKRVAHFFPTNNLCWFIFTTGKMKMLSYDSICVCLYLQIGR